MSIRRPYGILGQQGERGQQIRGAYDSGSGRRGAAPIITSLGPDQIDLAGMLSDACLVPIAGAVHGQLRGRAVNDIGTTAAGVDQPRAGRLS